MIKNHYVKKINKTRKLLICIENIEALEITIKKSSKLLLHEEEINTLLDQYIL